MCLGCVSLVVNDMSLYTLLALRRPNKLNSHGLLSGLELYEHRIRYRIGLW